MSQRIIDYTLPSRTRETLQALQAKLAALPESYGDQLIGLAAAQRHGRSWVRLHGDHFVLDEVVLEQLRWDMREWALDITLNARHRWGNWPDDTRLTVEVDSSTRLLYSAYLDSAEICLNKLEQGFLDTTGQQTYMKDYDHAALQDLPGIAGVCYVRHAELFKTLSSYVSHYTLWWEREKLYIVDIGYPYKAQPLGTFMPGNARGRTVTIRVEAPWLALAAEVLRDSPVIEVGFPRGTREMLRQINCGLYLRSLTGPHVNVLVPGVVADLSRAPWDTGDIVDGFSH